MHASNQIRHLPPSTVKHRNRWNHYLVNLHPSQKPCQLHFQHLACPHFLPTKIVFLTNWRTTNAHGQLLSFSSHASNFWICKVFGLWSFPPGNVLLNCAAFYSHPGERNSDTSGSMGWTPFSMVYDSRPNDFLTFQRLCNALQWFPCPSLQFREEHNSTVLFEPTISITHSSKRVPSWIKIFQVHFQVQESLYLILFVALPASWAGSPGLFWKIAVMQLENWKISEPKKLCTLRHHLGMAPSQ